MLKFTYLVNMGLVGALVVPAAIQGGDAHQLESSIRVTDQALASLQEVQSSLARGEYAGVDAILGATETPFGNERERSALVDRLRTEIGELEMTVQTLDLPPSLQHLSQDPTQGIAVPGEGTLPVADVATTGLTPEERTQVGQIWPPVPGTTDPPVRVQNGTPRNLEPEGFTVDAVRQGRAYYRASRFKEALRLFTTREGEPEADYWMGRCFERLDREEEAVAAYTRVIENENSGALGERAKVDRDFLRWLIDFERKVSDRQSLRGGRK